MITFDFHLVYIHDTEFTWTDTQQILIYSFGVLYFLCDVDFHFPNQPALSSQQRQQQEQQNDNDNEYK